MVYQEAETHKQLCLFYWLPWAGIVALGICVLFLLCYFFPSGCCWFFFSKLLKCIFHLCYTIAEKKKVVQVSFRYLFLRPFHDSWEWYYGVDIKKYSGCSNMRCAGRLFFRMTASGLFLGHGVSGCCCGCNLNPKPTKLQAVRGRGERY